jgi:hypothetical protein
MCGEISAGILFRDSPHPYRLYRPQGKGGLRYKSGREKLLLKKFGMVVPKAGFEV